MSRFRIKSQYKTKSFAGLKAKTIDTNREVKIDCTIGDACLVIPKQKDREKYSSRLFQTNKRNLIVCYEW